MDIVLGVSMTPTTVRMVLVEGEKADGVTVDHDVFDIHTPDGSATSGAAEQVAAAVLGTQESAAASGHHLKSIGVTWTHHSDAAALRDIMEARGIEDVMLVSATHAAASLAQAVGRAIGYDTTALLFIEKDTATLSVVQTEDGSVVKMLSRDLHDSDAMAVLTEMAKSVESAESSPQGMFIVGSGVDASAVKAHLENLVTLPVSAPDEPELALARGAALASAHAPEMEASTAGLAYSQDHDGTTAASAYPELVGAATQMAGVATQMAGVATQMAPAGGGEAYSDALAYSDELDELAPEPEQPYEDESRKPFLLVGSALTSIFVVGVVALVISLAVSIRPTVDQRPSPGETPVIPSQAAPDPVQRLAPAARTRTRTCSGRAGRAAAGNHQGAGAGGAAGPGTGAADRVRRAARTRARGGIAGTSAGRAAGTRAACPPGSRAGGPGGSSRAVAAGLQPAGVLPAAASGVLPAAAAGLGPAMAAVATDSRRSAGATAAVSAVPRLGIRVGWLPRLPQFGFGRLSRLSGLGFGSIRRRRFRLARWIRRGSMLPHLLPSVAPTAPAGYPALVYRLVSLSN